jgi:CBS domain-containing protein
LINGFKRKRVGGILNMLAKDVMKTEVVTVQEDTPITEVFDLLIMEHISGVPVVDRQGDLVGVVSQVDLFFGGMTRPDPLLLTETGEPQVLVRDVMTSPPVCIQEDEPISTMAERMCRMHIHRLPVVRDGKLTGIVTSIDLCRVLCSHSPTAAVI